MKRSQGRKGSLGMPLTAGTHFGEEFRRADRLPYQEAVLKPIRTRVFDETLIEHGDGRQENDGIYVHEVRKPRCALPRICHSVTDEYQRMQVKMEVGLWGRTHT